MPKTATVRLSGPEAASDKLSVSGFAPATIVAAGPLQINFRIDELEVGTGVIDKAKQFAFEFALPPDLIGRKEVELKIETSRVVRPASDPRDFGVVFGTFAIR